MEIVRLHVPGVEASLAAKVVAAVQRLRGLDLAKPPGVAETIDWVESLAVLDAGDLDPGVAEDTLGAVVKDREDLELVRDQLERVLGRG